jgi:hypothetical protein
LETFDMALGFETASTRMEPLLLVSFQAPEEEAKAVMARLVQAVVLEIGHYDRCSFQSAAGYERYRPREGAAAGTEEDTRKRPGVVEISLQLARNRHELARAIDMILEAHSYQEPVILVHQILASRSKGGDPGNPNRWWNKGGDWRAQS